MGEPFNLRPDEIANLTDRQVFDILFYPRDKEGKYQEPTTTVPEKELSQEEQRFVLFTMGREMGIPEDELERIWQEKYGDPSSSGNSRPGDAATPVG